MYGENKLNAHHTLRYGYTIQFMRRFRTLRYKDIEIPTAIIRPLHVFIKPAVDNHLSNAALVDRMRQTLRIRTMADVQKALYNVPATRRKLSVYPHRKTIVMPASMARFAVEQFRTRSVILLKSSPRDDLVLEGIRLPRQFIVYDFKKAVRRSSVAASVRNKYRADIKSIVSRIRRHPVFTDPSFSNWLYRNSLLAVRTIDVLERLIRKYPVGLIMDTAEIINPAATMVLLAHKFGIPFVTAPQVLITDRTFIPARATHYFVWGKHYRNWMVERGVSPTAVKIVGSIRMEQLIHKPQISRQSWLDKHNLSGKYPIVAVSTQPFPHQVQAQVSDWLQRAARTNLPLLFVIKPHPYDHYDYSSLSSYRKIKVLPQSSDPYEMLMHCDILATISSTTGIEASLFHKPVFVLQPDIPYLYEHQNNDINAHLANADAGPVISDADQWIRNLSRFAYDSSYRKLLAKQTESFRLSTVQTERSARKLCAWWINRLLNVRKR